MLWLDYRLAGVDEPSEMARLSGRDVGEFYRAADRRKRHTERLLAAQGGAKIPGEQVMSERKHADLWRELVDEAGEDAIDRAATVSVAQAEAELKAAGFDVAAERAKANAFLDALVGEASSAEASSPTAKEAATRAIETARSPTEGTRPASADAPDGGDAPGGGTRRKASRARVVWLTAAAAFLAVVGGTVYEALQPELAGHPPPTPSASAPVVPSATDLAAAADLRHKAAAACDAKQWSVCLAALDEARAVDPGGDEAVAVKALREKAVAASRDGG